MRFRGTTLAAAALTGCLALSGCGGLGSGGSGFGSGGGGRGAPPPQIRGQDFQPVDTGADSATPITEQGRGGRRSTLFDLFTNADDPNTTLEVNKYLWNASLEVLNFLPIETADPFTGVIVTGYGSPPGGGRAYRATIHITDPALDARSLKVAIATSGGPAAPDTVRVVEDAILTRARQLRIRDGRL